jgi:hypothetical protein
MVSRADRVALGVQGSYAALEPIIDKYRSYAAAVYFPYPQKLSATPPQGDDPALMILAFDIDQLALAAHAALPLERPHATAPTKAPPTPMPSKH